MLYTLVTTENIIEILRNHLERVIVEIVDFHRNAVVELIGEGRLVANAIREVIDNKRFRPEISEIVNVNVDVHDNNVTPRADKPNYFGDLLNQGLAEFKHSVWSLSTAGALEAVCKELPDILDIFKHVTSVIGVKILEVLEYLTSINHIIVLLNA